MQTYIPCNIQFQMPLCKPDPNLLKVMAGCFYGFDAPIVPGDYPPSMESAYEHKKPTQVMIFLNCSTAFLTD